MINGYANMYQEVIDAIKYTMTTAQPYFSDGANIRVLNWLNSIKGKTIVSNIEVGNELRLNNNWNSYISQGYACLSTTVITDTKIGGPEGPRLHGIVTVEVREWGTDLIEVSVIPFGG